MTSPGFSVLVVHAADLHIDSPLLGLERYPGAPTEAIRGATRRAFEALVTLCVEEGASLLVLAGDIYDGDWKDYSTGLFFAQELSRLREVGTRVVLVRGNHDAASQITRNLRLPDHVVELPVQRAGTQVFEDLGIAVHGQSYRERAVREDLSAGYPEPIRDLVNIGVLHTSLSGREGHEPYAPSRPEALLSRGYDYWALGHVHRREVVAERPWIVYPGNLQGRHAKETGPKGATTLEVDGGRVRTVEPRALDVVRWEVSEVPCPDAANPDDVLELCRSAIERAASAAEGRALCLRLVLAGATRAHPALMSEPDRWDTEIRRIAGEGRSGQVWIEQVRVETSSFVPLERLAERRDAVGQIARALCALEVNPDGLAAVFEGFADLRGKLPVEAREGLDALRLDDPELQREILLDVERLLVPELAALGDDS